jgi:lambda family phage tail tape measure protein
MSILARLGVKLALDSSEFKAGLEDATKNTKQFEANQKRAFKNAQQAASEFGATMGKVGLGVGIAMAGLYKIFEKADAISDMADAFDTSIGAIVGMGKALEMSGGKAENLGTMLAKLAVNTQEARDGSDKLRDAFKQVGLTAAEVQKLNPEQLMQRVAEQLGAIEDPILRNAKAIELLGKSAKGIDWAKYVEQYKNVADPDLAAALKDAGDAWDNIQKGVSQTYYFIVKLVQPFAAIVNYLSTIKEQYKEFKEQGGTINFDPDNPMAQGTGFNGAGKPNKPKEAPKPLLTGDKYEKLGEKEKAIADKNKQMLAVAKLISEEYRRQQEFALQQLDTRIKMAGMTENERKVQEVINQVLDSTSRKIEDITKKREDAARSDATPATLAEYDRQIEKVKELSELFVKAAKIKEQAAIAEQRTFEYGWNKAFAQYAEDAGNYGKLASDMFNSFTGNMASAVDKFVDTGKIAFGDFASSVIKDLIKIQLRMQIMQLFSYAGKGIGGLFTGSPSTFTNEAGGIEPAGSLGFADGGEPPVGVASLVGERGPELFVPKTAGTIIPNHQLSSVMNNAPQTVYNGPVIQSMQAIDTQSGIQFLAKNKMTIWSMNQSANRSIPAGR